MTDVCVPADLWEDGEASISAWLYQTGDRVQEGATIADMMVEKANYELVAPKSGLLTVLIAAEQPIAKSQVVATID
jgi:pyruvate/2-oxoglutarate dehydrogenase complex dihydrolipoamide acyltransferase (E2) component